MAQHIQEVMAISLDLQTAISDQFPSKIARGLIEGVLRIRSMLSVSWKKYGTFFRLCQKYSGRYISLCRKAAGSQIGSDSPSTIALIKTAGTARKQVLQMRADHRRITAEFDAHAKKMPTELRRNETSSQYLVSPDREMLAFTDATVYLKIERGVLSMGTNTSKAHRLYKVSLWP